jgi:PHP family Zn ribbon phosphoesterase
MSDFWSRCPVCNSLDFVGLDIEGGKCMTNCFKCNSRISFDEMVSRNWKVNSKPSPVITQESKVVSVWSSHARERGCDE